MDFKIIKDEEAFLAEKEAWTALYKQKNKQGAVTPFQSWEWCFYWWKYREENDSLFVIKAFTSKKIEGYAPLVVKDGMVEFIGGRDMDYGRFLINDTYMKVIQGFIETVENNGYGFSLQEMAAGDSQLHMVQRYLEGKKRYLLRKTTRTTYIKTEDFSSFDQYIASLSSSMRLKTIKPALKKGIKIQREPLSETMFQDIEAIYASRQEARGGAADISWAFPVIKELVQQNMAEVYIARVEEKPIGFLVTILGYQYKSTWLVAFHLDYLTFFPGQMLFYQVIKDGFDESCQQIDFMRGEYDFKMRWNVELDTNYTVYVYPTWGQYFKNKFWFWIRPKLKKIVYSNEQLKRFYKKHAK